MSLHTVPIIITDPVNKNHNRVPHIELLHVLSGASEQFLSLGVKLGVPVSKLEHWKRQNDNYDKLTVQDMLIWLADKQHITWDVILKALYEIGRFEDVQRICDDHGDFICCV